MGIVKRQSIKGTVVSYGGVLLGYINLLWLFPFILEPEQIGLTRVFYSISFLFYSVSQLGTSNIAIKFFPYFKDREKKHKGFFLFLILYPLLGFLIGSALFLLLKQQIIGRFEENSPLLVEYFFYLIPLALFMMYHVILESYCASLMRIAIPKFIKEVVIRVMTAMIVVAYYLDWIDFDQFVGCFVGLYGVAVLILLFYIKNLKSLFLRPDFSFIKTPLLKQMVVYGSFMVLSGAGGIIVSQIDTVMLSALAGLDKTGIYAIAFYIGTIIEMPKRSITRIMAPVIADAHKNNDLAKISQFYSKSSINQLIIGGLLFIGIWANVDHIFELIPNSETYRIGKYVVLFIGLAKLWIMACGVNNEIIINSRYYRFNLYAILFLAVITIITNLIFIPRYGINGAAMASLLSIFLFNTIKLVFIHLKFRMLPFDRQTMKVIGILLLTYGVAWLLPALDNVWINILLKSAVILVIYSVMILVSKVSEEVAEIFQQLKSRI